MKNFIKKIQTNSFRKDTEAQHVMHGPLASVFNKAKDISMSPDEKNAGLDKLRVFMASNPISATPQSVPQSVVSLFGGIRSPFMFKQRAFAAVIASLVLILIGGSTSLAATGALPGDLLYPVKIHMNEKAESLFAIGAKSSAKVEAAHAVTRLIEVEQLAFEGKLTPENQAYIEKNFDKHADKVTERVNELKSKGDDSDAIKVSADFNGTLTTHRATIKNIAAEISAKRGRSNGKEGIVPAAVSMRVMLENQANTDDSQSEDALNKFADKIQEKIENKGNGGGKSRGHGQEGDTYGQ